MHYCPPKINTIARLNLKLVVALGALGRDGKILTDTSKEIQKMDKDIQNLGNCILMIIFRTSRESNNLYFSLHFGVFVSYLLMPFYGLVWNWNANSPSKKIMKESSNWDLAMINITSHKIKGWQLYLSESCWFSREGSNMIMMLIIQDAYCKFLEEIKANFKSCCAEKVMAALLFLILVKNECMCVAHCVAHVRG